MLRLFMSRDARRLKVVPAIVAAIAVNAGAPADSIIHVNHTRSASGLGALAGALDYTGANVFCASSAIKLALADAAAGKVFEHTGFVNCAGNGLGNGGAAESTRTLAFLNFSGSDGSVADSSDRPGMFVFTMSDAEALALRAPGDLTGAAFDQASVARLRAGAQGGAGIGAVAATVVPVPPALAMGVVGLLGAAVASRRFNRRLR